MTRDEALAVIQTPPYAADERNRERDYVIKKLGFSAEEFEAIMRTQPRSHGSFASDRRWMELLSALNRPNRRFRTAP